MSVMPTFRGQAFDPETIDLMGRAFSRACSLLGLSGQDDLLTSYIARTVVETAHRGLREPAALADAVMQRLEEESVIGWHGEHFAPAAHHRTSFEQAAE